MCALGCFRKKFTELKFAKWILVAWIKKLRMDYWSGRSGEKLLVLVILIFFEKQ